MTQGRRPERQRGSEQKAQSPDRRARLAKALKANIARRKQGARVSSAHPAAEAATPAGSPPCRTAQAPAENPAESGPADPRRR